MSNKCLKKPIFLFLVICKAISVVSLALNPPGLAFQIICLVEEGDLQANIPKIKVITNQFEYEILHESHSYRTIPDAKFEFGIFSIFGNMTHKLSPSKRGEQVIEFVYLPPGNGFKL